MLKTRKKFLSAIILPMFILSVGFVFSDFTALAKVDKDFVRAKIGQAKNVKIHAKKELPKEFTVKGKPVDGPPGLDKPDDGDDEPSSPSYTTGVLGEPLPAGGKRYAVLVGICDYADPLEGDYDSDIPDICASDGDAWNMKNALVELYGYKYEESGLNSYEEGDIILLRDTEATAENIINAINAQVTQATSDDEVVFFYSGHGVDGNYVFGCEENCEDECAEGSTGECVDEGIFTHDRQVIWDDDLAHLYTGHESFRSVFIFDTCLAAGFIDLDWEGRTLVMAASEGETAFVYSTGEYGEGLFSHYFVKSGMLDGRADSVDHDGNRKTGDVTVEEAFDYADKRVRGQNPEMLDGYENDLLLGY